jgi:hypothetical protein
VDVLPQTEVALASTPEVPLPAGEPSLLLPKSGLAVEGGALVKRNKQAVVAWHPLESIRSASMRHRFDPFAAILAVVAIAVAILCKAFIASPALSWSLFSLFAGVALIGGLCSFPSKLTISTAHGEVHYPLLEATDEITGFYLTLRSSLDQFKK